MWFDTLKDYMILILGIIFGTLELIRSFINKKSKKYILILSAGIILLAVLGIDQINRNKKDKKDSDSKIQSLVENIGSMQRTKTQDSLYKIEERKNRIIDSIGNVKFRVELLQKFNIKDSANYPVKNKNFNTSIGKARDVFIGNDK